jgi:predicted TPR repeat methyltransferase
MKTVGYPDPDLIATCA